MTYTVVMIVATYLPAYGILQPGDQYLVPLDTARAWVNGGVAEAIDPLPEEKGGPKMAPMGLPMQTMGNGDGPPDLSPYLGDNEFMLVVAHADDDAVLRPVDAPAVYWIGTVEPLAAEDGDFWFGGDS